MKPEELIEAVDEMLRDLSDDFRKAKESERDPIRKKINRALDNRLKLMKARNKETSPQ